MFSHDTVVKSRVLGVLIYLKLPHPFGMEFKKETVRNIHAKRMTLSVHIDVIALVGLTSQSN